jgi:hypothetical protein
MAFLLCQSIGQLLSSATKCCTVPCRNCCEGLSHVICSPFFPYLALTIGLNLPPTLWGVKSLANVGACDTLWLHLNAVATALHMVAAFYIVHKIQTEEPVQEAVTAEPVAYAYADVDTGVSNNAVGAVPVAATTSTKLNGNKISVEEGTHYRSMEGLGPGSFSRVQMLSHWTFASSSSGSGSAANSVQRLGQVLCYDAGVAVYIIICCAWMVWQSIGMSRVLFGGSSSDDDGDEEDICGEMEKWMVFSIICGFLYLMLVCFAFGCSILCLR